ncbi:RNA-directed DNA polymerase, eukaryota, partial [Tanacetum coccineum]
MLDCFLRRPVRGGVESHQLSLLNDLVSSVSLSNSEDRWVWNLKGNGLFRVCDIRNLLDEKFLSKVEVVTRWIKYIPIKINIFDWKVCLDRLPTRLNLVRRDIQVSSLDCPICSLSHESTAHIFYSCSMASDLFRLICRWWDLDYYPLGSYADWLSWFKNIRMGSTLKSILEDGNSGSSKITGVTNPYMKPPNTPPTRSEILICFGYKSTSRDPNLLMIGLPTDHVALDEYKGVWFRCEVSEAVE